MSPNDPTDDDQRLGEALRASRGLHDAPEALVLRAIGLWQPRAAAAPGGLRRLLATLSFDSAGATPLALGLRSGAGTGTTRQLLFSLDGRDLDLRIAPSATPGRWSVSGQVLGPDAAGSVALAVGDHEAVSDWNELAEFAFDGVPAGACSLVLHSADWEAALPPIDLPPAG